MSKTRRIGEALPEVMQTASQLGCRSVHTITQSPRDGRSPDGRHVYTFIFVHFGTIHAPELRPRGGFRRPRRGGRRIIHV